MRVMKAKQGQRKVVLIVLKRLYPQRIIPTHPVTMHFFLFLYSSTFEVLNFDDHPSLGAPPGCMIEAQLTALLE